MSPESWVRIPSVPLLQSRECDTAGGNHMLSEDSSKLFVYLVVPFRRAHLTKAGEMIMQHNEQTKQNKTKKSVKWLNKYIVF